MVVMAVQDGLQENFIPACPTYDHNGTVPLKHIGNDVHGWPVCIPLLGAGTWQYNDTIAYESACKAFRVGIQLIDTAFG